PAPHRLRGNVTVRRRSGRSRHDIRRWRGPRLRSLPPPWRVSSGLTLTTSTVTSPPRGPLVLTLVCPSPAEPVRSWLPGQLQNPIWAYLLRPASAGLGRARQIADHGDLAPQRQPVSEMGNGLVRGGVREGGLTDVLDRLVPGTGRRHRPGEDFRVRELRHERHVDPFDVDETVPCQQLFTNPGSAKRDHGGLVLDLRRGGE